MHMISRPAASRRPLTQPNHLTSVPRAATTPLAVRAKANGAARFGPVEPKSLRSGRTEAASTSCRYGWST